MHGVLLSSLILVLVAVLTPGTAASADDSPSYYAEVLRRTVRVGMFPCAGYHNYAGGEPAGGYGFDYMQRLRGFAPWEYQYSEAQYMWADMLPMLEAGKVDMVSFVQKTPELEARFAFSKHPVCEAGAILTVKEGNQKFLPGDYGHWNGIRVGLLKGGHWADAFRAYAKEKNFSYTPVYYAGPEQMVRELQNGLNIDAAVANDFRTLHNERVYAQFGTSLFYIAVRKNDGALLSELNRAMEAMNDSQPEFEAELRHKYYYESGSQTVPFSKEEKEFIARMKSSGVVFTAIMNPDRKPISSFENGEYHGALKDAADEIISRTGLSIRFLPVQTREEYAHAVQENLDLDLIFDFHYDHVKAEKLHFVLSEPYFRTSTSLLHRKELPSGFRSLAFVESSNEPAKYNEYFAPDAKTIKVKTMREAIDLVRSGKADAMYLHTRCAEYAARIDWSGCLAVQFLPSVVNEYSIAVRDNLNPLLYSVLNKSAASIDDNFINAAYFRHMSHLNSPSVMRKLLAQHPIEFFIVMMVVLGIVAGMLLYTLFSRKTARRERGFYRKIAMSINEGVIVADLSGRVVRMNLAAERMTGFSCAEAANRPIGEVFHVINPDDGSTQDILIKKSLLTDSTVEMSMDAVLLAPDGSRRCYVEYSASPIHDDHGGLISSMLTFRDVTDEIKRREQMQRELSQWAAVSKIAKIHRFVLNYETKELFGDVPQDIWPTNHGIAKQAEQWIYPEDAAEWRRHHAALVSGMTANAIVSHRIMQDGKMRYFRAYMQRDVSKKTLLSGVIQEVTDIVELREKQEAAAMLWQTCIDSVPFMMFVKSSETMRYQQCNASFAQFFNLKPEEVIGRTDSDLFTHSPFINKFMENDLNVISKGVLQTIHESGIDNSGRNRHIMSVKVPAKWLNGEPILICMAVDETEEYEQRIALQNLMANRDAAAEMAHVATYQMNYKTWEMSGSKNLDLYWPIVDGKGAKAQDVVIQDDEGECVRQYEAIIANRVNEATVSYRIKKADGIHVYRLFMRKDSFIPDTITGLMMDVTDFVNAQNKSNVLQNLWHAIADSIPAILFVKDADDGFRYLYANNNLGTLLKTPASALIGHTESEFMPADDAARIKKSDAAAMNEKDASECYELIRDVSGVDHHFRSIKIPSVNEFGHRILIQMTTDVTEVQELSEVRKIVSQAF